MLRLMTSHALLQEMSELAWQTLLASLDGLSEPQSWAMLNLQPDEYLHTEGSILSQIAHVANGKFIYASVGFRDTELRWRTLSPQIDALWPRLDGVLGWLHESHRYWLDSWKEVADLEAPRSRFDGQMLPGWKLIATMIHSDHYHAGQIQMQRAILAPSSTPPPPEGDLWESYCKDFPCW